MNTVRLTAHGGNRITIHDTAIDGEPLVIIADRFTDYAASPVMRVPRVPLALPAGELPMRTKFTLRDIIAANTAAGGKWFDPGNMRFFSSRLSERVYPRGDSTYFVSSERRRGERRYYSVRVSLPNGDIQTLGSFQAFDTLGQAHTAARRYAKCGHFQCEECRHYFPCPSHGIPAHPLCEPCWNERQIPA